MQAELAQPAQVPEGFRRLHNNAAANPLREHLVMLDALQLAVRRDIRRTLLRQGANALAELGAARRGDICVIAGNGPSLNSTDWDRLDGLDILASNYAADHPELASRITILSVVNPWVVSQRPEAFEASEMRVALPYYLTYWLTDTSACIPVDAHGGFSPALASDKPFSTRSTVSYFNLQLAFVLGYRRVLLIGFDHRYEQPANAAEGDLLHAGPLDRNHFDSRYFAGKVWQAADVSRMEVAYATADIHYQRNGCSIINCTPESHLHLFPKLGIGQALALEPPAIVEQPAPPSPAARLVQRLRSPCSRIVQLAATLIALPAAAAGAALAGSGVAALLLSIVGFISAFTGVLLLNASVNVHRQQTEDDWAEIFASLRRAKGSAQGFEHHHP